jgi:hypothetical protein
LDKQKNSDATQLEPPIIEKKYFGGVDLVTTENLKQYLTFTFAADICQKLQQQ